MNTVQQAITALMGVLMVATILAMPAEMPGKSGASNRAAGLVSSSTSMKCQESLATS